MSRSRLWEESGNKYINLAPLPPPQPRHNIVVNLVEKYAPRGSSVLDIGCGFGLISLLIKRKNPLLSIYIADAYQQNIDITKKRVDISGHFLLDKKTFNLEVVAKDFDVVVMSHVLEHLLDPVGAIKKSLAVTKIGGYLVLAVPNPARPDVLLKNIFRKHYVNRDHVVAWDRSHWINFLEGILSLEVVEYRSDIVIIFPNRIKRFLPFLTWFEVLMAKILPWWSYSNIAVIKKTGDEEKFCM